MTKMFKCWICSRTYAISTVCFHTDKDGKEFGVRTKPIEIKPTKPKDSGYLYKPVGGVNDSTV